MPHPSKTKRDHSIVEAFLQNAEGMLDLLLSNEAAKAVPVVGTAVKLLQGADDLRSRATAAKFQAFLDDPGLQGPMAVSRMKAKLAANEDEFNKAGEVLFLLLDRLIDLDKPKVLAKVFVAYLDGKLDLATLKRLAQAIDAAFADDLFAFLATDKLHLYDHTQSWMVPLQASGLTLGTVGPAPPGHARTRFEITPLGLSLWDAWHHVPAEA